jgi:hypothetical protein
MPFHLQNTNDFLKMVGGQYWLVYSTVKNVRRLSGHFNCSFKLFDNLWVQDMSAMKGKNYTDVIFEIYPVAALASDQAETGFEQKLFRLGGGQAWKLRQRAPQGLM